MAGLGDRRLPPGEPPVDPPHPQQGDIIHDTSQQQRLAAPAAPGAATDNKAASKQRLYQLQREYRARKKNLLQQAQVRVKVIQQQLTELQQSNSFLRVRVETLQKLVSVCEDQLRLGNTDVFQDESIRSVVEVCEPNQSNLLSLVSVGGVFYKLNFEELRKRWRSYTHEVSTHILQLELARDVSAEQRLDATVSEIRKFVCKLCFAKPTWYITLSSLNMETGVSETASPQHWQQLLECISLSEQQTEKIVGLIQLCDSLREVSGTESADFLLMKSREFSAPSCTTGFYEYFNAVENVARSMNKNLALTRLLHVYAAYELLTSLQIAKSVVFSYPYFTDPWAILNAVVESKANQTPTT